MAVAIPRQTTAPCAALCEEWSRARLRSVCRHDVPLPLVRSGRIVLDGCDQAVIETGGDVSGQSVEGECGGQGRSSEPTDEDEVLSTEISDSPASTGPPLTVHAAPSKATRAGLLSAGASEVVVVATAAVVVAVSAATAAVVVVVSESPPLGQPRLWN